MTVEIQKIEKIFFPIACQAIDRMKRTGNRFAYYTTADVAYQIIRDKRMWMRSPTTMNDFMEIQYGLNLLQEEMLGAAGAALQLSINNCHPGLFDETWQVVQRWLPGFKFNTYITCISEHDANEDELGRLSMWRAYGGKTGVALVINGTVLDTQSTALAAYSSPVSYFDKEQFSQAMFSIATNITENTAYISNLQREFVKQTLFTMFRFGVLCTKHPGFAEEREWRIIATPVLESSALLESEIAIVRNVPQPILKIPLEDRPEHNFFGLSIPSIIDRVIIGPCEFPTVTGDAIWIALKHAGIQDPTSQIITSNIPLRHT